MAFKVNTPPVIHQTLDGEVIVVNLDSGTYYSIAGTGAEIWAAIEGGAAIDEAVEWMLARYGTERAVVEPAVAGFVAELVEEQLIVPIGDAGRPSAAAAAQVADATMGAAEFDEPMLNRYTDMQELLMLDPIHEVDEQGWPNSLETTQPAGEG
jgi:hypothetical protein